MKTSQKNTEHKSAGPNPPTKGAKPAADAKRPPRPAWLKIGLYAAAALLLLALPKIFPQSYTMGIFCRVLMYAVLAGSLNVINGYSGQFNIGHAGFYCIGAYTEAILATRLGMSFWIALPLAGLMAAIVGLCVALPTLRLRGTYLAITTLGASEIIRL
ncbi:MAG: branched-chain amino acid ABC transporter permease, partial [Spirochaetaceae bacterium]|nr:branched-chain amino acid ABC transporter permease [Spirochaetaceae bacterium]